MTLDKTERTDNGRTWWVVKRTRPAKSPVLLAWDRGREYLKKEDRKMYERKIEFRTSLPYLPFIHLPVFCFFVAEFGFLPAGVQGSLRVAIIN